MTDYKQLCAELVEELAVWIEYDGPPWLDYGLPEQEDESCQLLARARAALAESEPQRRCIYNPVQIAECGGPCEQGPEHCDCGELCVTEPEPEGPVVGELVVVAHWGDFDYPMDAVRLGRLREIQEQDGKTYYYVDDLRRGFRHCRTLTPRVLPTILSTHD